MNVLMGAVIWASTLMLYVGLFVGVGGMFFICWIGRPSRLHLGIIFCSIVAGAAALLLSLFLDDSGTIRYANFSLRGDFPDLWRPRSIAAIAGVASFTTASASAVAGNLFGKVVSLFALLGTGVAFAAGSQVGMSEPQWMTGPAIFLHAVGITFWAGALLPLVATLKAPMPEARDILNRFSEIIPFAVMPLIASGLMLALLQLGELSALWMTAYGEVMMVKLALFVALIILAVFNRFWLTGAAECGDAVALMYLRRVIAVELCLVIAIFAVAALWRFTDSPRSRLAQRNSNILFDFKAIPDQSRHSVRMVNSVCHGAGRGYDSTYQQLPRYGRPDKGALCWYGGGKGPACGA